MAFNMARLHRSTLLLFVLLLSPAIEALGQSDAPRTDLRDLYSWGDDYFIEVIVMPGESGNKSRVSVLIRLTYDLLTFRKTTVAGNTDDLYIALPSVYVEAEATDGVVADYDSWSDTVSTTEYRQTNSKQTLASGSIELALRPGRYTITYTVDDGSPGNRFTKETLPFTVPDFGDDLPAIGTPIMLRDIAENEIHPAAMDGNAPFGQSIKTFIPLASVEAPEHLRCEFYTVVRDEKTGSLQEMRSVGTGIVKMPSRMAVGEFKPVRSELVASLQREEVPEKVWGALCEFDASELEPGEYALEITAREGGREKVDTQFFQLKWIDMPYSLSSTTYAIKALRPIATDDEIDRLLGVGKEKQNDALWQYWKNLDPTPETVYNERMAEYYRRVDYAFFNFATLQQQDGVFTDRGKIYILFGPPTETRREFDPDANPKEIWRYDNVVKREFVFRDRNESGTYRLVEYYDL